MIQLSPTLSRGGHFFRRDSAETDDSPFSSGLTTPADEEALQPFDRIILPCEDVNHLTTHAFNTPKLFEPTTPKPRSLSRAVVKAKQFVQNLGKSTESGKRKNVTPLVSPRSASIEEYDIVQNLPIDPPLVDPQLGNDLSGKPRTTIFNLPNEDIENRSVEAMPENSTNPETELVTIPSTDNVASDLQSDILESSSLTGRDATDSAPEGYFPEPRSSTAQDASGPCVDLDALDTPLSLEWPERTVDKVLILAKVICFLPWCIAVGGVIILCPSKLELIAFNTGYHPSPLRGIQRFAYWADCAMQHVAIFCAFVLGVGWWNKPLGMLFLAGILAGFCFAWGDFVLDRSLPLGDDDRQTIFLVATDYGVKNDRSVVFQKTPEGYLVLEKGVPSDAGVTEAS